MNAFYIGFVVIRLNARPHSLCSITDRPDGRGAAQGHLLILSYRPEYYAARYLAES